MSLENEAHHVLELIETAVEQESKTLAIVAIGELITLSEKQNILEEETQTPVFDILTFISMGMVLNGLVIEDD